MQRDLLMMMMMMKFYSCTNRICAETRIGFFAGVVCGSIKPLLNRKNGRNIRNKKFFLSYCYCDDVLESSKKGEKSTYTHTSLVIRSNLITNAINMNSLTHFGHIFLLGNGFTHTHTG